MPGVSTAYQTGIHSARPANGAGCVLYSCTTHGLVYRDDGSSWTTFLTLPSAGFTDPMTTRGDIIVRNASNATARLAKGSADTFLHSDGTDVGYAAVTDAMLSTSDVTTNNASTSKHGFLKKLSNSATDYMDGTGNWSAPAGGGGGGGGPAQSFVGYNTVGGTWNTMVANGHYYKQIVLSAAGVLTSIDAYLRPSTDNTDGFLVEVAADNSGAPGVLVAACVVASPQLYLSNSASMPGAGRWVSVPIGVYLAAGTYWIGVGSASTRFDLASDGSGSDQTFTASIFAATGGYPTAWTITTGTKKYSIRASVLSGGGLTSAFVGYNTVGGSSETPGVNSKVYVKQVTLANDCLIDSIGCHISPNSGEASGPSPVLYTDTAGAPDVMIGYGPRPSLIKSAGNTFRWVDMPMGIWVPAGTYWIGVRLADLGAGTIPNIHYDGSGSDRTVTGGTTTHWDWGSYSSPTTTSNKYSIRAHTLR